MRSRFLEKTLIYFGFEVRHLGIYRANSLAEVFFSRKIISNAIFRFRFSSFHMSPQDSLAVDLVFSNPFPFFFKGMAEGAKGGNKQGR